MNVFFVVILAAVIVEFAVDVVYNLLNLAALKPDAPEGLQDVYEPDEYRRSQEYTRVTTRFGLVTSTFKLALFLAFWLLGGFNALDLWVRDLDVHVVVEGLVYLGVLFAAYSVVTLPFGVYATFVIEERFGFNKTTWPTFIADRLKGLVLLVVLGGPLLAALLAFFEYTGSLAWLYAWGAVTLFILAMQFIVPTWIMPLFNKFAPLEEGELRRAIVDYARSVDFTIDNILVMDGSKRSSKANAFFTGFGKSKRIALFDTLIENQTVPQLVAVLAHEIGHYKMKHILQGMVLSIAQMGIILFLLSVFLESGGLYDAFFMDASSVYTGLVFFGLLYTPIEMVLSVAMQAISRRHEYEGDRFAVETVSEPGRLIDALKKLSAENLSNLAPHPFYVVLNYTHPPLQQRVQAIDSYVAR